MSYSYRATFDSKGRLHSYEGYGGGTEDELLPAVFRCLGADRMKYFSDDDYQGWDLFYMKHGLKHRDGDQPAVTYWFPAGKPMSSYRWYINGKKNREGFPAHVEYHHENDYLLKYYIDGEKHRDDGPAVINSNGTVKWYTHGKFIKEKKWSTEKIDANIGVDNIEDLCEPRL